MTETLLASGFAAIYVSAIVFFLFVLYRNAARSR